MTHYSCEPFRPIQHGAFTDKYGVIDRRCDAALVFGDRLARRIFGRRGYCANVRLDNWHESGRYANYEVFVGVRASGGGCSGHNEWITVYTKSS